ncbi:hypothetical protein MUCCIDRAFT_106904 [Mucor lusitanicus CBS 277.49]|uniref:Uncharacterized protein n=2 Tax=Mucor circinelloides f. lusitanicus TaxID=29924 RepID=A0A162TQP5_MUCCL|nr:hypothetical protein MUCCIDRAFT_106904 [Mucor lusitanicus CBS 277.49]
MYIHFAFERFADMNLIEKVKTGIDIWRIEKYTKRRAFSTEFKSRDLDYYKKAYCDGVYTGADNSAHKLQSRIKKRASSIFSIRSSPGGHTSRHRAPPSCSETYNQKTNY